MKTGIFGGTFNPPHNGHMLSAATAIEQLGLDLLVIVPSGIPPHKPLPNDTPPAGARLQMVRMAFECIRSAVISNIEIDNPEPSYTAQTVKKISLDYPGSKLFLLVGADMFLTLESWKDYMTLLDTATPAVFSRRAENKEAIAHYAMQLHKRCGIDTEVIDNTIVDISSSELRDMLPMRDGAGYIKDTIYLYIIKNRLYGAKPDWGWLRSQAYSMLDPGRIPHAAGCEEEALRLARRWGADPDDAREAAILHDISKKLGLEENIRVLEEHGIPAGDLEFAEEKLLHPKTGALLAKSLFGVSDEVADAIMWHTTGRAGMSLLEKVIYVADYIEPNRDLPGIESLRAAAYDDINAAMRMGLEMSIRDVSDRGIVPNSASLEALSDLCNNRNVEGTGI